MMMIALHKDGDDDDDGIASDHQITSNYPRKSDVLLSVFIVPR